MSQTTEAAAAPWFRHVDHTGSGRSLVLSVTVALTGATAVLAHDPHASGSYGTCPVLLLTGFYCPGCGSLRGTHDLLSGDLGGAVGHNLLLVPALVWLAWWWLASAARWAGVPASRFRSAPSSAAFSIGLLVVAGAFTVARNLPGSPLAP